MNGVVQRALVVVVVGGGWWGVGGGQSSVVRGVREGRWGARTGGSSAS